MSDPVHQELKQTGVGFSNPSFDIYRNKSILTGDGQTHGRVTGRQKYRLSPNHFIIVPDASKIRPSTVSPRKVHHFRKKYRCSKFS